MTMEVIQHIELGSAQASISFSSIPATFTDLYVLFSVRQSGSGVNQALLEFNGSSSNFSYRFLQGSGSAASSGANTLNYGGLVQGSASTSNTFSSNALYIPNYASSTAKSWSIDAVTENNATEAYQHLVAGLWNNTAAINSIAIKPFSGNLEAGSSATLYGIRRFNTTLSPKATGGAISYDSVNNKWVHAFYTSGTFTPTENLTGVEYLVIAGGGSGGGADRGGGGGAGGYRSSVVGESSGGGGSAESTLSLTASTNYTVTIGAGGAGVGNNTRGINGNNSSFDTITATGGGGGGHQNFSNGLGQNGGSGGGAGIPGGPLSANGGTGTTNQGRAGGGSLTDNTTYGNAGGGGGANTAGNTVTGSSTVGTGGNGVSSSITGTAVTRAGGGGGAADATGTSGVSGGSGGGGLGGYRSSVAATAGTINTGSGGGGAGYTGNSGAGGSGLVIVRYSA